MKWIRDRYKIIRRFQGSGLSRVFLCRDFTNDDTTEVVVKVFEYGEFENADFNTQLFFREIENLENLNHSGIVRLLDKGKDDENSIYYMVLDYFDGQTLDKLVKDNSLSEKQKYNILLQIMDVIIFAHSKQINHRDLKPGNILINDLNEIKVIDFGTSKIKNSLYNDFTVSNFVTPKYASWEQKSFKTIDHRTDIYSLGIIVFELLTNDILDNDVDLKVSIEESPLISDEIKRIILKMVEMLPDNRYNSMAEVRNILKAAIKRNEVGPVYGLSFTTTAVNNLLKFGYIRNLSRNEATQVIYHDLVKSITYMEYDSVSSKENQPVYKLYGKQLEYRCVIDNLTQSTITVKSIHYRNVVTHEANKERAILVEGEWDVVSNIQDGSQFDDAKNLIEYIEEKKRENSVQEKSELSEKSSIERWQRVLRLYSQSLEESRNTLKYSGFERDALDERIWVELSSPLERSPFTDEQLLSMTSRANLNKTKVAGYCVDYDENRLVIQLEKNANVNDFAQSGEISVDQRMVETALHRQKRALKAAQHREMVNNSIPEILFDPSIARSSNAIQELSYHSPLDESKKEAIEKALAAKDIFLLQGPPGTGKTTFISELVYQINKEYPNSKILISSQSNVAVDHALNKIKSILPGVPMLRIGRRDKMSLGAERFTIEEQLDDWFEEIKNLCVIFIEEYKQLKGIDEDLVKRYQVTLEVSDLEERMNAVNQMQIENRKKTQLIKERFDALKNLSNQIQKSAATIQGKVERVNDSDLLYIITSFKEQMLQVSDNFISELDKSFGLAEQKELLEVELDELQFEELVLDEKAGALKKSINVTNAEELINYRKDIELQLEQKKEDYEQIGKLKRIQDEWIDRLGKDDKLTDVMLRRTNILGATCLGVASVPSANNVLYDWIIIDEAGRATPPELLVPMTLGRKIVLVGDHKQLPPLVDQQVQSLDLKTQGIRVKDLEVSLFEELMRSINQDCVGSLKEQYRMHPAIGNLVSKVFYDGTLVSKTSIEERSHGYSKWIGKGVIWLSTAEHPERFEQVVKQGQAHNTYLNRLEARTTFQTLLSMEQEYILSGSKKEVGIIAGYQAQKSDFRKLFETEYKHRFKNLQIEINTVDAFQGRETDIIVYSVVRSNKEGEIGFLGDARRLNVALSRARELLVIVGDHISVTKEEKLYRDQANPFVNVIRYIEENPEMCAIERIVT